MTDTRCLLCANPASFYCDKPPARYHRCRRCGTIFQHPMPSVEAMRAYSDREYAAGLYADYVGASALKYATFRRRLEQIRGRADGRRLLDVGCSCGYLIDVALEGGFDAWGVEFSENAVAAASPQARPRILQVDVNTLGGDGHGPYDVVTAFDIVEHTQSPREFLAGLRALLRPGGLLVLTTPDTGHVLRRVMGRAWPHLQPLQHTCLFSRPSLMETLRSAGFDGVELLTALKMLTADYLASQVRVNNPFLAGCYARLARAIPAGLRNMPLPFNIGEMIAFARRAA